MGGPAAFIDGADRQHWADTGLTEIGEPRQHFGAVERGGGSGRKTSDAASARSYITTTVGLKLWSVASGARMRGGRDWTRRTGETRKRDIRWPRG